LTNNKGEEQRDERERGVEHVISHVRLGGGKEGIGWSKSDGGKDVGHGKIGWRGALGLGDVRNASSTNTGGKRGREGRINRNWGRVSAGKKGETVLPPS